MTRTLARLGTAAGSLGLALACAGTAVAATPATSTVTAVATTTPTQHGLLSGLLIDVVTLVGHLLTALL